MLLQMQEQMGVTPQALLNRPVLTLVQYWFYTQFAELSTDRRYTEGSPLRITTSEILEYCNAFGIPDFEDFYSRIRVIDSFWMDEVSKKTEKEQKASKPQVQSTPAPRV